MDSRPWREATLAAIISSGTAVFSGPALADCVLVGAAGDTAFICDSGTSPGFSDLSGNNSLALPVGGSGMITGDVTFGNGNDRVEVHSGTITGAVIQGDGLDDFVMTGGVIGSLQQGGDLDTFFMSGGHIIGTFDAGDNATFTGGRIGNVTLQAADNRFVMSGGSVDNNVSATLGDDTIIISGGQIGGFVSVGGGTDSVTLTGGSIGGEVRMGTGNDSVLWDGGGTVGGAMLMGDGADTATLRNLTDATLALTPKLDGEGDRRHGCRVRRGGNGFARGLDRVHRQRLAVA